MKISMQNFSLISLRIYSLMETFVYVFFLSFFEAAEIHCLFRYKAIYFVDGLRCAKSKKRFARF